MAAAPFSQTGRVPAAAPTVPRKHRSLDVSDTPQPSQPPRSYRSSRTAAAHSYSSPPRDARATAPLGLSVTVERHAPARHRGGDMAAPLPLTSARIYNDLQDVRHAETRLASAAAASTREQVSCGREFEQRGRERKAGLLRTKSVCLQLSSVSVAVSLSAHALCRCVNVSTHLHAFLLLWLSVV